MASRWLLPLLLLALPSHAEVSNDFSFYPSGSQSCLDQSADAANCTTAATIAALNTCLCGNNNDFVINSAKCLGKKDASDVDDVYGIMYKACNTSGTPLSVTESEFKSAASEGATASATTSAASSTATNDNDSDDKKSSGLSSGVIIGIGVGAAAVGAAAVAGVVYFILRRRKRSGEESHPMLGGASPYTGGPTTFPPVEPQPPFEQEGKPPAWSPDPAAAKRQSGWDEYATADTIVPGVAELPPEEPGPVYEMDGGTTVMTGAGGLGVAEMDGEQYRGQHSHQAWGR